MALRASASWTAWGPYESVTPVVTTPKGSHGANYARARGKEKRREALKRKNKEKGRGVRTTGRRGRYREQDVSREEKEERNVRGRPNERTEIQGTEGNQHLFFAMHSGSKEPC